MPHHRKPRVQFVDTYARSVEDLAIERMTKVPSVAFGLGVVALEQVTHAFSMRAMSGARRSHVNMRGRLEAAAAEAVQQAESWVDTARASAGAHLELGNQVL